MNLSVEKAKYFINNIRNETSPGLGAISGNFLKKCYGAVSFPLTDNENLI